MALTCHEVNNLYNATFDTQLLSEIGDKLITYREVELEKSLLTKEDLRKLDQKETNAKWLFKNYDRLKSMPKYQNKFVAVKNKQVVGSGKDYERLVSDLKKEFGSYFCSIAVEYVTIKKFIRIPSYQII